MKGGKIQVQHASILFTISQLSNDTEFWLPIIHEKLTAGPKYSNYKLLRQTEKIW